MKTQYQKLNKYGINTMVFGKSKKKDYLIFWVMIAMIFIVGMIF